MLLLRKHIDLDFDKIISMHKLVNDESCIDNLRKNQTHNVEYPKTYIQHNTLLSQNFHNTNIINESILQQISMKEIISVSTICQLPGNIIPPHKDTFYVEKLKRSDANIIRANVFLKDCKIGHSLHAQDYCIHDSGIWLAGDVWIWDNEVYHSSSNGGFEPKYTMQITGILAEDAESLN